MQKTHARIIASLPRRSENVIYTAIDNLSGARKINAFHAELVSLVRNSGDTIAQRLNPEQTVDYALASAIRYYPSTDWLRILPGARDAYLKMSRLPAGFSDKASSQIRLDAVLLLHSRLGPTSNPFPYFRPPKAADAALALCHKLAAPRRSQSSV